MAEFESQRNSTGSRVIKILVIQTAFLGDLLLSTPLLKNLRRLYPHVEIFLVCRRGFGSLFKQLSLVEHVFEIEKKNKKSYSLVTESLSRETFDLLLAPHESFTTAQMVRKLNAKTKVGFRKWWNKTIFDRRVSKDYSLPDALRQLSLMTGMDEEVGNRIEKFKSEQKKWKSRFGLLSPVPDWASAIVSLPTNEMSKESYSFLSDKFIVLFPGSVWKTKQWIAEGFYDVLRYFHQKQYQIVLLGTQQEFELCQGLSRGFDKTFNLAGKTNLLESLQILARSEFVFANDSAGQHLAALVGVNTISIFGPTVQSLGYRAWNSRAVIVEKSGLTCRPCGKHGHHRCPVGTHECMTSIGSKMVIQAALQLQEEAHSQ